MCILSILSLVLLCWVRSKCPVVKWNQCRLLSGFVSKQPSLHLASRSRSSCHISSAVAQRRIVKISRLWKQITDTLMRRESFYLERVMESQGSYHATWKELSSHSTRAFSASLVKLQAPLFWMPTTVWWWPYPIDKKQDLKWSSVSHTCLKHVWRWVNTTIVTKESIILDMQLIIFFACLVVVGS